MILVTGRVLEDLIAISVDLKLFDAVVAENGALFYDPSTQESTPLGETPPAAFLEEPFTLSEPRAIYEEVWGIPQDPSNFRRKVLRLEGFVTPVGEIAPPRGAQGGRPAELYRRGPARLLWPPLRR